MKRLALITVILGSVLAIAPVAGAVVLSDGGTGGSVSRAVPKSAMDPAIEAVLLSKGVSTYSNANAVTLHTDVLGGKGAPFEGSTSSTGNSFGWSNALAVTLGAMLILAIAATTVTRRRQHRLSY